MGKNHPKRGDAPTRDHIYPQSQGGKLTVICCRKCNGDKGDWLLSEWAVMLTMRRDWRAKRVSALAADLANGKQVVLHAAIIGRAMEHLAVGIADGVFA